MNRMEFQISSFKLQVSRNKIQTSRLSIFETLLLATSELLQLLQLLKLHLLTLKNSTLATFETCNF